MKDTETYEDGRLKRTFEPISGILTEYVYSGDSRVVVMSSDKNATNFKTILNQQLINNEYVTLEKEEHGETYVIKKKYSNNGEELYSQQINNKTGKTYIKKTLWQNGQPCIWTSDYGNEKNIGFYLSKNILTGLTNNI